jgi:hypothetical protein
MYGKNALGNCPEITLDKIEGIKIIVENYNDQVDKQNNININEYVKFLDNLNEVFKYTVNNKHLKRQSHNISIEVMDSDSTSASKILNKSNNIRIVMDENQSDHVEEIVGITANSTSREDENKSNIRELNIVPINIHALMKAVPLINIYNYEFIFDYMVHSDNFTSQMDQLYGINNNNHNAYLMLDPYVTESVTSNILNLTGYKMLNKINARSLSIDTTLYRNLAFMVMATNFLKQTLYNKLVLSRNLVDSESHSLLRPEDVKMGKFPHVDGQSSQNEPDYFNKRRFENYDDTNDEI